MNKTKERRPLTSKKLKDQQLSNLQHHTLNSNNTKTGAIKCFDELIEKKMLVDPSLGYINKGVALRQLKRYDESLACFEEVRGVR